MKIYTAFPHYHSTNNLKPDPRIPIKLGTVKMRQGHTLRPVSEDLRGCVSSDYSVHLERRTPTGSGNKQINTNIENLHGVVSRCESNIVGITLTNQ